MYEQDLLTVLQEKLGNEKTLANIDKKRIPKILKKIEKVWKLYPEWSFGKVIYNAYDVIEMTRDEGYSLIDIFEHTDEDLEKGLDLLLGIVEQEKSK